MTPNEFEYIKRAMAELESGDHTDLTRYKLLRTVSQITGRAADEYEQEFQERVDASMARQYQDIQNQKLLKVIQDA